LIRFIETAKRVKFFFLIEESFIGNGERKSSFFLKKLEFGGVGGGFRADGAIFVPVLVGNSDSESFRERESSPTTASRLSRAALVGMNQG